MHPQNCIPILQLENNVGTATMGSSGPPFGADANGLGRSLKHDFIVRCYLFQTLIRLNAKKNRGITCHHKRF